MNLQIDNSTIDCVTWIAVGLVAGWLAGHIVKGSGYGFLGDILVGVIGGTLGGFLFGLLGLAATGIIGKFIIASVGAILMVAVVRRLPGGTHAKAH